MNAVQRSHGFVDSFMARAGELSAGMGKPVRCAGRGCFGCCKEPVMAERAEAKHIIDTLPAEKKPALQERVRRWLSEFLAGGLDRVSTTGKLNPNAGGLMRYRAAALWCPLLHDGECTAYNERPAGCRYHSALGHPQKCYDDAQRKGQRFLMVREQEAVNMTALGLLCENAPRAMFEFDHLGLWLAHSLLGETMRSSAAADFMITQTDPQ